jgi:hypothetical protein
MKRRMRTINFQATKRFTKAWGPISIEFEREVQPERWLLLGIRERPDTYYPPLRCYARGDSKDEVAALAELAAVMAERGDRKLEIRGSRYLKDWCFAIFRRCANATMRRSQNQHQRLRHLLRGRTR